VPANAPRAAAPPPKADTHPSAPFPSPRDSIIYQASCPRLGPVPVAVKVYELAALSASKLRAVRREAAMMIYLKRSRIPGVVRHVAAFDDAGRVHLVMEACPGGDLLERLLHEGRAFAEPRTAAEVAAPLLATLAALHARSIVHRDVKLENVFIAADGRARLGDYGLTVSLKHELAISPVGTVEYMAPEVIALPPVELVTSGAVKGVDIAACDEKVDVWALGVTLYELLTGHLPFEGADRAAVKEAIVAGRLRPFPRSLSPAAVSFVSAMLRADPAARPSAAALLRHPFIERNTGVGAPAYAMAGFPPVCADVAGCPACALAAAHAEPREARSSFAAPSTPPPGEAEPRSPVAGNRTRSSSAASAGSGVLDVLDEVAAPPPPSVVLPPARPSRRCPPAALAAARAAAGGRGGLSPAPSAPAALAPVKSLSATASAWPPINAAPAGDGGMPAAGAPPARFSERAVWGAGGGRRGKPLPRAASAPSGFAGGAGAAAPSSVGKRLRRALRSVLAGSGRGSGAFGWGAAVAPVLAP